jgi:hypothetical protein
MKETLREVHHELLTGRLIEQSQIKHHRDVPVYEHIRDECAASALKRNIPVLASEHRKVVALAFACLAEAQPIPVTDRIDNHNLRFDLE